MKNLFLAESDFAASGNAFALALATQGEDVHCLVARHHCFAYPDQGQIFKGAEQLTDAVAWADRVWIIQSDLPVLMGGTYTNHESRVRDAWLERIAPKQVVLLHGGGHYRQNRKFYANLWKDIADLSICYSADLMGSFPVEHLMIPPVNLKWFPHNTRSWSGLRIGHYPARPSDKGSEWIVPMMRATQGIDFRTSVTGMSVARERWEGQMQRMAQCDVIVDQIKRTLGNDPFGEWVSLATEAAALGRIPIANSNNTAPYVVTYGCLPEVHICNTSEELAEEVSRLKSLSETQLEREQVQCRVWVEQHHALEPTGRKLMEILCEL